MTSPDAPEEPLVVARGVKPTRPALPLAALILSLLVLVPIAHVLGVVLGAVHLVRTPRGSPGRRMAFAACGIGCAFITAWVGVLTWSLRGHDYKKRTAIYEVDLETGERRLLAEMVGGVECPTYGPHGAWVYFDENLYTVTRSWRVGRKGDEPMRTLGADNDVIASPFGDGTVAFSRIIPRGKGSILLVRSADGSERELHTYRGGRITRIVWAPDKSHIVLLARNAEPLLVPLDGSAVLPLLEWEGPPGRVFDVDWGANSVVFHSDRGVERLDMTTGRIELLYSSSITGGSRISGSTVFFSGVPFALVPDMTEARKLRRGNLQREPAEVLYTMPTRLDCFDIDPSGRYLVVAGVAPATHRGFRGGAAGQ